MTIIASTPTADRVEHGRDLAAWLLKDQPHWNRAAIDATIAAGQRHDISATKKIPVAWMPPAIP